MVLWVGFLAGGGGCSSSLRFEEGELRARNRWSSVWVQLRLTRGRHSCMLAGAWKASTHLLNGGPVPWQGLYPVSFENSFFVTCRRNSAGNGDTLVSRWPQGWLLRYLTNQYSRILREPVGSQPEPGSITAAFLESREKNSGS